MKAHGASIRTLLVLVAIWCVMLMASTADATDGTLEIAQVNGNSSGTGAFFVLTEPGSYRLTSNIVVPDGRNGIVVSGSATGVFSLDLNGFTISAADVTNTATGVSDLNVVTNGAIRGFSTGIQFVGVVREVDVGARAVGISGPNPGMVVDCRVDVQGASTLTGIENYELVEGCEVIVRGGGNTNQAVGIANVGVVSGCSVAVTNAGSTAEGCANAEVIQKCRIFADSSGTTIIVNNVQLLRASSLISASGSGTRTGVRLSGDPAHIADNRILGVEVGIQFSGSPAQVSPAAFRLRDNVINLNSGDKHFVESDGTTKVSPEPPSFTGNVKSN